MSLEVFLIKISPYLFIGGFILEVFGTIFLYKKQSLKSISENPESRGFQLLLLGFFIQMFALFIQNFIGISYGDLVITKNEIFFTE